MEADHNLFQYLKGDITFDKWQQLKNDGVEVVMDTGNQEVDVKQEPPDATTSSGKDEKENSDDVVYLGTETVFKYLAGELTFAEFNEVLENEVKEEVEVEDVAVVEEVVTTPSVTDATASSDSAVESRKLRKPRQKLPKKAQGLMGEANIRFARGQKEDAIKLCMEVIKLAPNAPEPYQTLGMIYDEAEDIEKALQFQLIAAHLTANDAEEWVQLAEMSLEQNNATQAISCYDRAIRIDGKNVSLWWARCDLLEKAGDRKKATDGYIQMLEILPLEEPETYFKLARDLVSTLHEQGDKERALKVLTQAFNQHPKIVTFSDSNLLLEMMMPLGNYKTALCVLIRFGGVKLIYPNDKVLSGSIENALSEDELNPNPTRCDVPDDLPIDLRSKLAICLIHIEYDNCVDEVVSPLMTENPDEVGDLYLDVTEAFTDKGKYAEAKPFLFALVQCENYDLAAVWLKYAECLNSLGNLKDAVHAFKRVIELAPSHMNARVSLSAIQQQLGRPEEALKVLQQEYDADEQQEIEDSVALDLKLKFPKCLLLYSQKKYNEFVVTAMDVLFGHFAGVFKPKILSFLCRTRSNKHRMEALGEEVDPRLETKIRAVKQILAAESSIMHDNLWDLFLKLMEVLLEQKRYKDMEEAAIASTIHPSFSINADKTADINFLVIHSCLLNGHGQSAFDFIRELCLKELENNQAWNLFAQVIAISQNIRHNRFCLRLMFKYPNHKALGILNGHNALVAGTYKHSLAEYITAFRSRPQEPFLSFCIGIVFIHLASQKFAGKRHSLTVQACAFLNQYLELRGECQETYYNLGRAMHQLGLLHAAVFYYQKGLDCPPAIEDDQGKFDLSRELAFNLCLIYKNSGSYDLASQITQKYLQI